MVSSCISLAVFSSASSSISSKIPLASISATRFGTIRDRLKARGILTAAGMGRFSESAFRIGHMGDIRMSDVERTLGALAGALAHAR